jgi:hypothetical protein
MDAPHQFDGHERALLDAFISSLDRGGTGRLTISQLLPAEPALRYERQLAIWRLSDRGWLLVSSSQRPQEQHECSLTEEGLRMATSLASRPSEPQPN